MSKLIILFASVSMCLYIAKVTSISPVYVVYGALLIPALTTSLQRQSLYVLPIDMLGAFALLAYISATQFRSWSTGEFANIVLALAMYLYLRTCRGILTGREWLKCILLMSRITLAVLSVDTVYRLMHPTAPSIEALESIAARDDLLFYEYKFGSLMFADSNTTGLVAMILLFSLLAVRSYQKDVATRSEIAVACTLVIASLSRSAVIASALGLLLYFLRSSSRRAQVSAFVLLFLVGISFVSTEISTYFVEDGSFQSKFEIFHAVGAHLHNSDLFTVLFGTGLGSAKALLHIHTHNIYLTYLVETGAAGLLLFLIFVVTYVRRVDGIVLAPTLIASLSYFLYIGTPFLFTPLALVANFVVTTRRELGNLRSNTGRIRQHLQSAAHRQTLSR